MTVQYSHSDFNSTDLLARKNAEGIRISVLIPTRNESATIANIVSIIKTELMEAINFVDEIIVADNGSTDNTDVCARNAGALTPDLGNDATDEDMRGKGWTLRRGVACSTGDIIICIDADIRNFDIRFVLGLAGPLLCDPSLMFAKAYYRRPIVVDEVTIPDFGGRVTELVARPMLALFYPDLAPMHQPLSGEYAFRRKLAIELPFWSGYGVEVGLLLHIRRTRGLSIIAEVDMGERVHRNRGIRDLGRMSFGILKTLFTELMADGLIDLQPSFIDSLLPSADYDAPGSDTPQVLLPALNDTPDH